MAGSRRRSASASPSRPAFRSRMTSRTQAGRGKLPMTVVGKRVGDTVSPCAKEKGPDPGVPGRGRVTLGSPHPEVELPELEGLVRVRSELHVLLEPVVLVGLDDEDP